MTDNIQPQDEPQPEPLPVSYGEVLPTIPPQKKQSSRNWIILAVVGFVIFCLCLGLCGIVFGRGIWSVAQETDDVSGVIDSFMQYMSEKDVENAYDLFSARAKQQTPMSSLEDIYKGNNYVLFEGYESLSISQINIGPSFNTNPNIPQGTVAKIGGSISYTGNFTGQFEATLEQENGGWKIYYINITVPPDKFNSP